METKDSTEGKVKGLEEGAGSDGRDEEEIIELEDIISEEDDEIIELDNPILDEDTDMETAPERDRETEERESMGLEESGAEEALQVAGIDDEIAVPGEEDTLLDIGIELVSEEEEITGEETEVEERIGVEEGDREGKVEEEMTAAPDLDEKVSGEGVEKPIQSGDLDRLLEDRIEPDVEEKQRLQTKAVSEEALGLPREERTSEGERALDVSKRPEEIITPPSQEAHDKGVAMVSPPEDLRGRVLNADRFEWQEEGPSSEESTLETENEVARIVKERLSERQIEETITRTVKEIVSQKAERVLLEVAERLITEEIEKLKKLV
nr:hypothetical protein [Desulfobacterales bacterium]